MDDYLNLFLNDHLIYAPFYDHVYSYWQLQHFDNILLIKYEDMIADPLAGVEKISKFLNYNYDMKQLEELVDHVPFGKMREKASHRDYSTKSYKWFSLFYYLLAGFTGWANNKKMNSLILYRPKMSLKFQEWTHKLDQTAQKFKKKSASVKNFGTWFFSRGILL